MKVRIGYGLGVRTKLQRRRASASSSTRSSGSGFDSLWLSERIGGEAPDPLVAMAFAAGSHRRTLKFGMSVHGAPRPQPGRAGQGAGHARPAVRRAAAARVRPRRRRPARAAGVRRRARASGPAGSTRRSPYARRAGPTTPSTTTATASTTRACGCCPSRRQQPPRRLARRHRPVGAAARRAGWPTAGCRRSSRPTDVAAGRAVIEQVAAEHDRAIDRRPLRRAHPLRARARARQVLAAPRHAPPRPRRPVGARAGGWDELLAADRIELRRRRHAPSSSCSRSPSRRTPTRGPPTSPRPPRCCSRSSDNSDSAAIDRHPAIEPDSMGDGRSAFAGNREAAAGVEQP